MLVGALDGVEVLQAVDHDEREEDRGGGREDAHLARAHRVSRLHQPGIVDVRREDELGRADSATAHGLLRQEGGIALGDASASSRGSVSKYVVVHAAMLFLLASSR